jgi:formyl-CoA transferase
MSAALPNLRVIDVSIAESGPSCAQWLAWYGADVIRVDRPPAAGVAIQALETGLYLANNMNKRSIFLDYTEPEGLALLHELVGTSDVLIENFRTGVADALGFGAEQLRAINPGLIYCSIKGFGSTGPRRHHPAFDPVAQAASGAMSVTGDRDGPPMRTGYVVGDSTAGTVACTSVLAAYVRKLQTGEGAFIDISMQEALMGVMRSHLVMESFDGRLVKRRANRMTPPTDLYPCAPGGPNDYVHITAPGDKLFDRVAVAIGRPELVVDERFATHEARLRNGRALWESVAEWTRPRTKWEAMDALTACDVPASAVYDNHDLQRDPHLVEREAIVAVRHPGRGSTEVTNNPVRAASLTVPLAAAPRPGEHTADVLAGVLGKPTDEIESLASRRIVTIQPPA